MDKRTKQTREAKYTSDDRRKDAYNLVKAMAENEGVPLPNARNEGVEYDKWFRMKESIIDEMVKIKNMHTSRIVILDTETGEVVSISDKWQSVDAEELFDKLKALLDSI